MWYTAWLKVVRFATDRQTDLMSPSFVRITNGRLDENVWNCDNNNQIKSLIIKETAAVKYAKAYGLNHWYPSS